MITQQESLKKNGKFLDKLVSINNINTKNNNYQKKDEGKLIKTTKSCS